MTQHFADRLERAVEEKGSPVCVGVDPVYERLPAALRHDGAGPADRVEAIRQYCLALLEAVAPIVPAVKPQSAYFELYQADGVRAYFDVVARARSLGLLVIGDVKRGDIGSTARAYAEGHLAGPSPADAVTVNGYFGQDGLAPFVELAAGGGGGVFVLVRTSNPSGKQIQDFAGPDGRKFYEHMAERVRELGAAAGLVGQGGYSCVGAVVGATYVEEARRLREMMPQQIFLVPGYGAQGATAADCAACFRDGRGAIVNASRSVIFAYQDKKYAHLDWRQGVEQAACAFADDIRQAVRAG